MFDSTDAALLAEMSAAQRAERMATARRILAAGRLCQLRTVEMDEIDRAQWCIDNWEALAAEVGAELGVSRGRASSHMNYGIELLERLPRLGAVFAAGDVDFRIIVAAVFRTGLITDPAPLAQIDAVLARRVRHWNALSEKRLVALLDRWVADIDPAALRTARTAEDDRHVEFSESRNGTVEFWGTLRAADAAVLERTLDRIADSVCDTDPRTKRQRRADALAALAHSPAGLACECALPTCTTPTCTATDSAPTPVVIHLIAEEATVRGDGCTPGYLPGTGMVPAQTMRDLARRASLRPLTSPALLCTEPRYRPSAALADYIKCRDLFCRFPGCDRPAEVCDIDHTVAWQSGGPTHPSSLALLCRAHHLLKTFWSGEKGWSKTQYADGTIVWTSPSQRTYTTKPGGTLFFPQLNTTTETLNIAPQQSDSAIGRTLMMPTRRRTRAEERSARISWERGLNEARWAADPPPF